MFLLIFFFKRKTAYEMRISDWSSDVCSSDLAARVGEADHLRAGALRLEEERREVGSVERVPNRAENLAAGRLHRGGSVALQGVSERVIGGDEEIGRATCRERVCRPCRFAWSWYNLNKNVYLHITVTIQ